MSQGMNKFQCLLHEYCLRDISSLSVVPLFVDLRWWPWCRQYHSCSYYEMQHCFYLRVCTKQKQNCGDNRLESRGNHVSHVNMYSCTTHRL